MPVTELDTESGRQQVMVGVTNLSSKVPKVREQSKELDLILQAIAPSLYRGISLAIVEYANVLNIMRGLGLGENDVPMIYLTDANTQMPIPYKGKLEQNDIRKWAQDILKEA